MNVEISATSSGHIIPQHIRIIIEILCSEKELLCINDKLYNKRNKSKITVYKCIRMT